MLSRASMLAAALAVAASLPAQQPSGAAGPRVRTANGMIEGLLSPSGGREFRGIPFAAPPVRDLRWKAPQPVENWKGLRAADRFADQCMQARVFSDMVFRNSGTSEDCLYLNVWTPGTTTSTKLPVLVYFFGGGFVAGDGSEPRYDGASLAQRGIVVVTTSYRLGVFGFFAHPELTAESPRRASGDQGLLDQVAALRWVRANIAAFGGDPSRVTIAGESAGSFAVSGLMASPLSKDLIAGAIGESGAFFSTGLPALPLADAERNGELLAKSVGANSLADLRKLSAMELLTAAVSQRGVPRFTADVDGYFFPESPTAIYAAGKQAHVPLLAGWNSAESAAGAVLQQAAATPENFAQVLERTFGSMSAEAARVYPAATAEQALQSATDLASDRFIAYSTWKWLDFQSRTGGRPVYRYYYAHPRPGASGAVHSAEIEYALGNLATNHVYAWTPDDYHVSDLLERYFSNFIKTGNPNGPGLPSWPLGTIGADGQVMRMRIEVQPRAEPEPAARYQFLDRFFESQRKP